MLPGRLLVIDASLSPEVAIRLRERGRASIPVKDHGLGRRLDPSLLTELAGIHADEPWVLVTGDDKMPDEHADLIAELSVTVATVDGALLGRDDSEQMKREVVQRWAHKMAEQDHGSVVRYGLSTGRRWVKRRRKPSRSV